MPTLRIASTSETIHVHFGGDANRINAYTLASALVGIADAARAANSAINPGYDIEIVVEALGPGSFRAHLRSIYRGAGNLFSKQSLNAVILSVFANFVYQHTLAPDQNVVVNVGETEVVIEQGDTRIIVPRSVHEATKQAESKPDFVSAVRETIQAVQTDPAVDTVGFTDSPTEEPPVKIPRERFYMLAAPIPEVQPDTRDLTEQVTLQILRAILEKSRRRWEFVWNGTRISAPVTDEQFYEDFFAHRITVAPGDSLQAELKIRQRRLEGVGIFVNDSFEVVRVFGHVPRPSQTTLPNDAP